MAARENILLIRLKSIGDIVFTLPAVHVVRENFPRAKLHFLVSKENAQILRGFVDVDEIIPLDRAVYRSANLPAMGAGTFQLLRRLRRENFSLAIDFHGLGETALLSWWSGAPERWGSVDGVERAWAYTHGVLREKNFHPVDRNLSLLRQSGLKIGDVHNEYVLPPEFLDQARAFFEKSHLDTARPTLYLQPFTSSAQKNWPLENFLRLAQHFRAKNVQIIFSGGRADKAQLELASTNGFVVVTGVPRMADAGLMKLSTLIVGGDTGFLHLAVAMGKRALMLIKRKSPGAAVPFQHPDWIIEPPTGLAVKDIEFEKVLSASEIALKENSAA